MFSKCFKTMLLGLVIGLGVQTSSVSAQATGGNGPSVPEVFPHVNFHTASMFIDTLRADFIATGRVVGIDKSNGFPEVVFMPMEYLMGEAIPESKINVYTGVNSDLDHLIGQEIVGAVVKNYDRNIYGFAHSVHSITPESLSPQTSIDFYKEIIAINEQYEDEIAIVHETSIGLKYHEVLPYPAEVVSAWSDVLVKNLGYTGTQAAHHSGRELLHNPVFRDVLTESQLSEVAQSLPSTHPGTYDRGYGFLVLAVNKHKGVSISSSMNMVREETAFVNLAHVARYLKQFPEGAVVDAFKAIYMDKAEETTTARRNAILLAGKYGSNLALPSLRSLLGHETDKQIQHQLLAAFRELPDFGNFKALAYYLNGGDENQESGLQKDCVNNNTLHKRTLLAIAVIDDANTDLYIDLAWIRAKDAWLKKFLYYITSPNKQWRGIVEVLNHEDK